MIPDAKGLLATLDDIGRYLHAEGHRRGLCLPWQGPPGDTPTPTRCRELLGDVGQYADAARLGVDVGPLQTLHDMMVRMEGTPFPLSGFIPLEPPTDAAFGNVAGAADKVFHRLRNAAGLTITTLAPLGEETIGRWSFRPGAFRYDGSAE